MHEVLAFLSRECDSCVEARKKLELLPDEALLVVYFYELDPEGFVDLCEEHGVGDIPGVVVGDKVFLDDFDINDIISALEE